MRQGVHSRKAEAALSNTTWLHWQVKPGITLMLSMLIACAICYLVGSVVMIMGQKRFHQRWEDKGKVGCTAPARRDGSQR